MRKTAVRGLRWAKFTEEAPTFSPQTFTSAQKRGLSYEKKIAQKLAALYPAGRVLHGQWIIYEDSTGRHYAQPDILIIPENECLPIVVVEVKLSHRPHAERKLLRLYVPLLRTALGVSKKRKVVAVQVFRSVRNRLTLTSRLTDLDGLDSPDLASASYWACHSLG